jgi:hypothetical protein
MRDAVKFLLRECLYPPALLPLSTQYPHAHKLSATSLLLYLFLFTPAMSPSDFQLLTVVAEPKARKAVAKAYSIPSGAVPVLAAIGFWWVQNESTTPSEVYGAEMGSETLIRYYLGELKKAGLVERYTTGRVRRVRPTSTGAAAVYRYQREMREGIAAFGQVWAKRVLTHPLPRYYMPIRNV